MLLEVIPLYLFLLSTLTLFCKLNRTLDPGLNKVLNESESHPTPFPYQPPRFSVLM